MDVMENWRGRLAREYVPFSTWVAAAFVAAGTVVGCLAASETAGLPVLMFVVPFLCALPAMSSAWLTVTLRRFLHERWQLPALSAACAFVTMAGFALVYVIAATVARWDPSENEPSFVWPGDARAAIIGLLQEAVFYVLLPAGIGALVASISAALWLYREGRKPQAGGIEAADGKIAASPAVEANGQTGKANREERYFWLTTALGPVIVVFPIAFLLDVLSSPGNANGRVLPLLWFVLRLYYGGTFAAAVSAVLMLTLVFKRSRWSAWPAALCVGLHAGAIFLLLFAPSEGNAETQSDLPLIGGAAGALSAAASAAIWFPDRRRQTLGDTWAEARLRGWALARHLIVAGLVAPLIAAFAYGVFVAASPWTFPDATFIGRLRAFDPEIWAIAYRIWAVVALQALALRFLLAAVVVGPIGFIPLLFLMFLFTGSLGHSLDDYVMSTPMPISFASFFELGLPGLVAALAALYFIDRERPRRAVEVGNAAA